MIINKKLVFIFSALAAVIVGISIFLIINPDFLFKFEVGCPVSVEERIVRGNSLSGLVEPGETVRAIFGYYDCNEIKREDIILYDYAGNENPLIKVVKGIPGDEFSFQEVSGGWHILINGKILENSKDQPYLLNQRGYNMLSLYEKDYGGIIPEQAYLIMGNLASGATDSTRYGLVHKSDILGKAELSKK
jgi:signal peptidase I